MSAPTCVQLLSFNVGRAAPLFVLVGVILFRRNPATHGVNNSRFMHHAERIAIWVGQDNVVGAVRIAPVDPSGAEGKQSFNLGGLVRRVQIEVVALMAFCVLTIPW